MRFTITKTSARSRARRGTLATAHGDVATPAFQPIATKGAVRTLAAADMRTLGADILLANTYHLWLRPGPDVIAAAGGLHTFMGWDGPILTDSGGYQVHSLCQRRDIREEGVTFRSHLDGQTLLLTPEKSVELQLGFGVDIAMVLDECTAYPVDEAYAVASVDLTTRWAARGRVVWQKNPGDTALFAIVQGSTYENLRRRSAEALVALDFPGYAIGGLAVGEPAEEMYAMTELVTGLLPADKPRYLMGVGTPANLVESVRRGVDLFDCVLPTRNARHGTLFIRTAPWDAGVEGAVYKTISIDGAAFSRDFTPLDPHCACFTCTHHTRAYLRHLFNIGEPLAARLATIHNLHFYLRWMEEIRQAIEFGTL